MKILIENGTVTAEAETIADVLALQALVDKKSYYQIQQSREEALTKKGKRGGNRWKGKHKVPCPGCGNLYKNLKMHITRAHSANNWSKTIGRQVEINHM